MKVLKFGGSSVGNSDRILQVIKILKGYIEKGELSAVVFSAFQKVTDGLISLANQAVIGDERYVETIDELHKRHIDVVNDLIPRSKSKKLIADVDALFVRLRDYLYGVYLLGELTPKTLDNIVSFGERLSNTIISEALNHRKLEVEYLDARNIIRTDDSFGNARVDYTVTNKKIKEHFKRHKKPQIVTGFIASTIKKETTTLGRGGSDYTASILGAALKSDSIEIWTDVDGILTADPGKVETAFPVKAVTYEEAMELSHFGAKVIYPPTMQPALEKRIKIIIKNTFNPSFKGTVILHRETSIPFNVKGISSIGDITLIRITGSGMIGVPGISSRLFGSLARHRINVILITQGSSEHTICIAVLPQDGWQAKTAIEEEFKYEMRDNIINKVILEEENSIIAVVGEDFRNTPRIAGQSVQALGANGINIVAIAQGSSELNISMVIRKCELKKALNVLHDALFTSVPKTEHVFLAGPGTVGKEFLELVKEENETLKSRINIRLKIAGISNSKKMLFDEKGVDLDNWYNELTNSNIGTNPSEFFEKVKEFNLPNSVFIDCTGGDKWIPYYKQFLESNVTVVTPNKIANSGPLKYYNELRTISKRNNIKFLYETNVCSATPVINLIKDLVESGDEILKIEGVLSGTLSYIFNSLKEGKKFSEVVKFAKESGYTEPDPRDDLNGLDVARKLLILARECGAQMELKDVKVENLIPADMRNEKSVDDFMKKLDTADKYFDELRTKALQQGKVLCYVAKYENGKATVAVEQVGKEHPFYGLSGNINVVTITTKYHNTTPLTLTGSGAGARLTASGVLTDILKISNQMR